MTSESEPKVPVTSQFLAAFQRERDYYAGAARRVAALCESISEDNAIRAIVTWRVKRLDRLADKIYTRNKEKEYTEIEQIREDIPDLAGVRIALYFPGDQERLVKILEKTFSIKKKKTFPEEEKKQGNPIYRRRFSGYKSTHLRVNMLKNKLERDEYYYGEASIEIQVGSVLMHAWAEVEHDIIYKPTTGGVSVDEYAILDELNGLVHAGEIALERLQRVIDSRLASATASFQNQYELSAFLYEYASSTATDSGSQPAFRMGQVNNLFRLINEKREFNTQKMRELLSEMGALKSNIPIADQIINKIVEKNPEYKKKFLNIASEKTFLSWVGRFSSINDRANSGSKKLFSRWVKLTSVMKDICEARDLLPKNDKSDALFRRFGAINDGIEFILYAEKIIDGDHYDNISKIREEMKFIYMMDDSVFDDAFFEELGKKIDIEINYLLPISLE